MLTISDMSTFENQKGITHTRGPKGRH